MARRKRASMREGPLADLFRSTDESVAPEERGHRHGQRRRRRRGARAGDAGPEPRPGARARSPSPSRTPDPVPDPLPEARAGPEPTPPEPVPSERRRRAAEDLPRGPRPADGRSGRRARPRSGARSRTPPASDSPARCPAPSRLRVVGVGGAGVNAVNRMVEAQLPGRRVRRHQHRPSVAAELERRRHAPHRRRA